jgi:hypothetical protein
MSLIFLKNDDRSIKDGVNGTGSNMKPYRWTNYFTNPIKIPPNSQVAFIKSNFQTGLVGDFEDADGYFTVGIPELNAPMPLFVSKSGVNDFTKTINNIGRDMNLYGSDGDFNHIYFSQDTYDGGTLLQDIYETGFNVLLKDDNKVNVRCEQRGVNDVFNQGFNNCGFIDSQVSPNGINTGTGDNTTLFKDNGIISTSGPYGPVFSSYPLGYPALNLPPSPPTGGVLKNNSGNYHYNTNYSCGIMDAQGLGIPTPLITPNANFPDITHMFPYSFSTNNSGGVFSMFSSQCGIKKNVFMDAQPTSTINNPNGGGPQAHASIAGAGSGGYAHIWIGKQFGGAGLNQGAEFMYRAGFFPPNRAGFCAIAPISFGVLPADIVDLEYGNTVIESRTSYIALNDLNNTGDLQGQQLQGNCDFRRARASTARYSFGVDIQVLGNTLVAQAKILDPQAIWIDSEYINVGPQLDIGELSAGFDTVLQQPFGGGTQGGPTIFNINYGGQPIAGSNRRNMDLHFRFRWTSPYTMCVEYTLQDDPNQIQGVYDFINDTPYLPNSGGNDPRTNWIMLYDMKQDPTQQSQYLFPSYMGDMRTVIYPSPIRFITVGTRGYYDNRFTNKGGSIRGGQNNKYPSLNDIPLFFKPPDELGTPLVQNFTQGAYTTPKLGSVSGTVVPEEFIATGASAGLSKKNIYILMDELKKDSSRDRIMDELGQPMLDLREPHNLHLGSQLGIINKNTPFVDIVDLNNDIDNTGNPFVLYGVNGSNAVSSGNDEFNLHYQLTNFGIDSKQGVASTNNKSIMVLNNIEIQNTNINSYKAYSFSQPFPLWIDLNNYGELNTQFIDVLITDDDNNEAKHLVGKHSLTLAFRQKPKTDEGYVPNNIPVVNYGETNDFNRIR